MNAIPFARLVREMRSLQKIACAIPDELVHTRDSLTSNVREKELAVDRAVHEILGQPTLFDRDDDEGTISR